MKKYFFVIAFGLTTILSNAQNVGVGVANPQNKLHVAGGFRLDTLTGVGGAGLLWHNPNGVVYGIKFTGNTNDVLRGDGSFGAFNINGAVGWLLNGNSGTNPSASFLGTTDNVPLNIRVNNLRSGLIDPTSGNTSWGFQTLFLNTNGSRNTATGSEALSKNTLGNDNTAIGHNALLQNLGRVFSFPFPIVTGNSNTAVGSGALYANTDGSQNTATGHDALGSNQGGSSNTAYGAEALKNNLQSDNSAFGASALRANTNGTANVAMGFQALVNNTTGFDNTAIGYNCLYLNNGYYNSALGSRSLLANTTGHDNTASGYASMQNNSTGSSNTSYGAFSMYNNLGGSDNTSVGYKAMEVNTTGVYNTATGAHALHNTNNSYGNTANGYQALYSNVGAYNVGIGFQALANNWIGSSNTAIGANAGYQLPNNVSNVTCVGDFTGWNTTSSNQVNIGNFNVLWIGGQTGWFHYSDKRIKNDIKDDVPGLAFISRLKPITYHVDVRKQEEIANAGKKINSELKEAAQKDWEGKYDVEKIKVTGFFAQDVEEAAKAINYSFNGVHNPKNGGLYSLDYSAFVVPLVKAVQEQQKIIEDQNKKIEKQQLQINLLIKEMQSLKKDLITQKN